MLPRWLVVEHGADNGGADSRPALACAEFPAHSSSRSCKDGDLTMGQPNNDVDAEIAPTVPLSETVAEDKLDLSVVIPALNEGANLQLLLPELKAILDALRLRYEILIVVCQTDDPTRMAASFSGARILEQSRRGYGEALQTGFVAARGDNILCLDADLSHQPALVRDLWTCRQTAEVIIASRYVEGGSAHMPAARYFLSRVLNVLFGRGLSLPVRDLSSGFRLYKADRLRWLSLAAHDFDILQEILVRAYASGSLVREIPFAYAPRRFGSSHAQVLQFGWAYLRTFRNLWKLRNSILSADYDYRAYDSPIALQRFWQRCRFRYEAQLITDRGSVLDVGCGSSRIIGALPAGSVALDIQLNKFRFARRFGRSLVQGSGASLPFPDETFPCVLCSQVIEHVPGEMPILDELCRVLAPGGRLILGTPDYARWEWRWMEGLYRLFAPSGYADEHITHYMRSALVQRFERLGLRLEAVHYILRGELILAFRKPTAD